MRIARKTPPLKTGSSNPLAPNHDWQAIRRGLAWLPTWGSAARASSPPTGATRRALVLGVLLEQVLYVPLRLPSAPRPFLTLYSYTPVKEGCARAFRSGAQEGENDVD